MSRVVTKQQSIERHLSAAADRWEEADVVERTSDAISRRDGSVCEVGTPKFELDFRNGDIDRNGSLTAQTSRSVLDAVGYKTFYAPRGSRANRDPKRIIVVVTPFATPIGE